MNVNTLKGSVVFGTEQVDDMFIPLIEFTIGDAVITYMADKAVGTIEEAESVAHMAYMILTGPKKNLEFHREGSHDRDH